MNAITIKNVSKRFRIPHEKRTTLFENLVGLVKGGRYTYEEFWALRNINLTVKKGETLGIIGGNGSGKTTLLGIIAGVLTPDDGKCKVNGRIAPFLDLGVGFEGELTAKENVYLYGAIMGIKRREINERFDEIIKFAELENFVDAKLKNFSSGMRMRLAFATAINVDPDILLIDEVLAVGDIAFQKKCFDVMDGFKKDGKTIVFVSHSLDAVRKLCDRGVLINKGVIEMEGVVEEVIERYVGNN